VQYISPLVGRVKTLKKINSNIKYEILNKLKYNNNNNKKLNIHSSEHWNREKETILHSAVGFL